MAKASPRVPVEPIERQVPLRDLTAVQRTLLDLYDPLLKLTLNERVTEPFLDTISLHLQLNDSLAQMLGHRVRMFLRSNPPTPAIRDTEG